MSFDPDFLKKEIGRTSPDYVVYIPACADDRDDHGNEHVHVFHARDGRLCALWTMSLREGTPTQRPVFSCSFNGGLTWTTPRCLLRDPIDRATMRNMGSWAAAAVSRSGRIYVIYNKNHGTTSHQRGFMCILCSDDCGDTWSAEADHAIPHTKYDMPDPDEAPDWVVWQNAYRLRSGHVIMGFTRGWLNPAIPPKPDPVWVEHPCGCEFFRLDNIDEDPEPKDLKITWLTKEDQPLTAPLKFHRQNFCAEEPSVCQLPDGRLFLVMRTAEGHVWYSVSEDDGVTWRPTEMLRYTDTGEGILHPLSPSPMFEISAGEYVLFIHNHDGYSGDKIPHIEGNWRNPIFLLKGEFRPYAHQPVWFSQPVEFMNNGGVMLGHRMDLALYGCMTIENGEPVLWYPDRKFFVLGKKIPRAFLDTLAVPGM